jgi:hypothetical protein
MMMKGPFRELIPVGEQTVKLRLPDDFRPGKIRLLEAGRTPRLSRLPGRLSVSVPSILDHEVIAIDTA